MPKKSTQDLMVFQVTPELRSFLEAEAVANGLSISATIRLRLYHSIAETTKRKDPRVTGVSGKGAWILSPPGKVKVLGEGKRRKALK